MTQIECRQAMHAAERHARILEEGNRFALVQVEAHLQAAERAYSATQEDTVAQRLHVAIDRIGAFA